MNGGAPARWPAGFRRCSHRVGKFKPYFFKIFFFLGKQLLFVFSSQIWLIFQRIPTKQLNSNKTNAKVNTQSYLYLLLSWFSSRIDPLLSSSSCFRFGSLFRSDLFPSLFFAVPTRLRICAFYFLLKLSSTWTRFRFGDLLCIVLENGLSWWRERSTMVVYYYLDRLKLFVELYCWNFELNCCDGVRFVMVYEF